MGRKAAVITQADIARVIRAAIQSEAAAVEIRPDGVIIVHVTTGTLPERLEQPRPPRFRHISL